MKKLLFLFAFFPATACAGTSMVIQHGYRQPSGGGGGSGWTLQGVFLASATSKVGADPWNVPTAQTLEVGNVGICIGAADNDGNGTDTDDFNNATDGAGNSWSSSGENEVDPGASQAGAAVQIQWVLASSQLTTPNYVQTNYANTRNSKAIYCLEFAISGTTVSVVGTEQKQDVTTGDAGSLTMTGLNSLEHLCVRAVASETGTTETINGSGGSWITIPDTGTSGSTDNTNMRVWGEYKIFTGSSSGASDPTFSGSFDRASTMICFEQATP